MGEMERWIPDRGTPQGAVLSPLANVAWDVLMSAEHFKTFATPMILSMCRSEQEARQALQQIQHWVKRVGLELHPDKTHLGNF